MFKVKNKDTRMTSMITFNILMSSDIAVMSLSLTFKVSCTQPANYAPGTSPEGSLKVLTSGTYKGPSGDSQGTNTKTDELMKKLFF